MIEAHSRLAAACNERNWRDDPEDPERPETIQAMQIVLNLPKQDPPARSRVLEAAARAVLAACLCGEFQEELDTWYGLRIRKVARRARNKAWEDVQALPGVTVDGIARAFAPSAVNEVPHGIAKLQIGGTDLPADAPGPALADAPVIYVDSTLGMSVGKAAAQVGHGSMLLASHLPYELVEDWAARDFVLSVREVGAEEFAWAVTQPGAVVVRDAGFTEVAPNSATVVALWRR